MFPGAEVLINESDKELFESDYEDFKVILREKNYPRIDITEQQILDMVTDAYIYSNDIDDFIKMLNNFYPSKIRFKIDDNLTNITTDPTTAYTETNGKLKGYIVVCINNIINKFF